MVSNYNELSYLNSVLIVVFNIYDVLYSVTTCVEIYGFSVCCSKRKIEPYFTF